MASRHMLIVTILYVISTWEIAAGITPEQIPLPLLCTKPLPPGKGVLVKEKQSVILDAFAVPMGNKCNITSATENTNSKMLINILKFSLGKSCEDGTLEIFDYYTGNSITGKLCGMSVEQRVFRPDTRVLYLVYTPLSSTTIITPQLDILLVSYNEGTGGKCGNEEFQCDNKLCIAKDLVCNGYDECSDNSDERGCESTPGSSTPLPVWVWAVTGLVLVALVVAGVFGSLKLVNHRRRRHYVST